MTDFFCTPNSKSEDQVTPAEATIAFHTVKHHYSYILNNCTSSLVEIIFSDSEIAKKYSCANKKQKLKQLLIMYLLQMLSHLF